jgi:hypothetical protein
MDMRLQSFAVRLLGTASVVALSAVCTIGALQPAAAQSTIATGLFGGGTTLSSLALRQIFNCYAGTTVANDGNRFSDSFTTTAPRPNLLPTTCTLVSTGVEGLFAAAGSGNGQRAYIGNEPHQLFRGSPTRAPARVKKPSANPPFTDANNPNFGTYPYPGVDFAASDSPLPTPLSSLTTISFGNFTPSTNWQNASAITAGSSTTATYGTATFGNPIQVPVLEVPIAIAIDTTDPTSGVTWNIQSALSPNTQAGGAIQLSAAQLCAIFSATVTDWNDTTTLIPFLDKNGVQQFQNFFDDNTDGTVTPTAYTSGHLPIKVVFRSDDSGTSFILTNYLANFCPLLDPTGTFNYKAIFTGVGVTYDGTVSTTPNLPSSSFSKLIENIREVRSEDDDHDHHDPFDDDDDEDRPEPHWISATGSNQEALKIGTDAFHAGRLGYLSPDFIQPYATTVSEEIEGDLSTAPAPLSASIQNQNQRVVGVYHPGQVDTGGTAQNFIPPTPAGVETAFRSLTFPTPTQTYNNWSVYNQVFPAGTVIGGVSYGGLSLIGDPQRPGSYPITGVTFLELYSCYSDLTGTRVPVLKNWLAWLFGGSTPSLPPYNPATSNFVTPGFDPDVAAIIRNNGFHELDTSWALEIERVYLRPSSAGGTVNAISAYNTSGPQVDACIGVTGGAD